MFGFVSAVIAMVCGVMVIVLLALIYSIRYPNFPRNPVVGRGIRVWRLTTRYCDHACVDESVPQG